MADGGRKILSFVLRACRTRDFRRLALTAEALREAVGYRQEPREHALREPYLVAARPRLCEARWDEAWAEGRRLGFEEAIAYALEKAWGG